MFDSINMTDMDIAVVCFIAFFVFWIVFITVGWVCRKVYRFSRRRLYDNECNHCGSVLSNSWNK
jgi:putative effector of murein hydrolase LrgA (UPF0299 family)